MKSCRECAKKDRRTPLRVSRKGFTVIEYICPRCHKKLVINKKQ